MHYTIDNKNLAHIGKMLPAEAFALWCDTANQAAEMGYEHNDCVRSAWDEVGKTWCRPATGKRWVAKDNPTASAVHSDVPLGNDKKPKKRPKAPAIDDEAGGDIESEVVDQVRRFSYATNKVLKVDDSLGLVFGWAIVCKQDGEDYFDLQGDNIPEDTMMKAAADFMQSSRIAGDMHGRDQYDQPIEDGSVVFAFPMTADIAKAMGVETQTTGLMIALKPSADVLQKFKDGSYTGFSIGGYRGEDEEVAD